MLSRPSMDTSSEVPHSSSSFATVVAVGAVLLVGVVLAFTLLSAGDAPRAGNDAATAVVEIPVHGMTCGGCVTAIQEGVGALPGVAEVSVDLPGEMATIRYDPATAQTEQMVQAIAALGYTPGAPKGSGG